MVHSELRFFQLLPDDLVFQVRLSVLQLHQPVFGFWREDALLDGFKDVLHLRGHLLVFGLQCHQKRFVRCLFFQQGKLFFRDKLDIFVCQDLSADIADHKVFQIFLSLCVKLAGLRVFLSGCTFIVAVDLAGA
ncbi:hypothetical protein [Faecalibaculum rodentium]|uniref:hypothetical protein n=1 Tax=Faecalibaculum rodentium TaxID=1702221 RepID=UPI0026281FB1|nr:hypothetical protein [Faecalibaculum rodentium]